MATPTPVELLKIVSSTPNSDINSKEESDRRKTKCRNITKPEEKLMYVIDEIPPIHLNILLGFQITLTNLSSFLIISTIIADNICADQEFKSKIFQTSAVISGIATIGQALIGVRLPIFQGPAIAGILPFIDAGSDERWGCNASRTTAYNASYNLTDGFPLEKPWEPQWKKIQGSMLVASVFLVILGLTGLASLIGRIVRPISVTVLFLLLGVYMWSVIADLGAEHWGISALSFIVVIICSQFIHVIKVPIPTYKRGYGCTTSKLPVFQLFSVFISIIITWIACFILTEAGALPSHKNETGYLARTDIYYKDIQNAPIFQIPYPGQFGAPGFDANYIISYIPIIMSLLFDAIADFHQYSVVCEVPPPPSHAVNRGIATIGFGAVLLSLFGAGHPQASFGNILGVIKITAVGSRATSVASGIIIILLGIFGKFGAVLVSIPKPVLFGPGFICIAFIIGTAFENLKHVELTRHRNQATLGIAIFFGCVVPFWISAHLDAIQTGSTLFDDILTGILKIPFLMGCLVAAFFDLVLPGKRDLLPSDVEDLSEQPQFYERRKKVYDIPFSRLCVKYNCIKKLPFMPKK